MTRSGTHQGDKHGKSNAKQAGLPSSLGDSPVAVTPQDVQPENATARDITERHTCSSDLDEREDAILDEAVELTFPASDPIAPSSVTKITRPPASEKEAGKK